MAFLRKSKLCISLAQKPCLCVIVLKGTGSDGKKLKILPLYIVLEHESGFSLSSQIWPTDDLESTFLELSTWSLIRVSNFNACSTLVLAIGRKWGYVCLHFPLLTSYLTCWGTSLSPRSLFNIPCLILKGKKNISFMFEQWSLFFILSQRNIQQANQQIWSNMVTSTMVACLGCFYTKSTWTRAHKHHKHCVSPSHVGDNCSSSSCFSQASFSAN